MTSPSKWRCRKERSYRAHIIAKDYEEEAKDYERLLGVVKEDDDEFIQLYKERLS